MGQLLLFVFRLEEKYSHVISGCVDEKDPRQPTKLWVKEESHVDSLLDTYIRNLNKNLLKIKVRFYKPTDYMT